MLGLTEMAGVMIQEGRTGKMGAKVISHSRRTIFQMAEVAVPEKLFRSMLSRIHRLGRVCARGPILSL